MSDMTSLSQEYAANADFAQALNKGVMRVKKARLGLQGRISSTDSPNEAREKLAAVLEEVLHRLAGERPLAGPKSRPLIPEGVLERLQSKHRSALEYFLEDLRAAQEGLAEGQTLDEKRLGTLDELCDIADASASASFRRLRRR